MPESRVEVSLPTVAGIGFRQTLPDGKAIAERIQRPRKVALRYLHVADIDERHRQVSLPSRVAGIRFRKTLRDGKAIPVEGQRPRKVALRHLHVPDIVVRY